MLQATRHGVRVQKYNPHHDPATGRFTSAAGGVGGAGPRGAGKVDTKKLDAAVDQATASVDGTFEVNYPGHTISGGYSDRTYTVTRGNPTEVHSTAVDTIHDAFNAGGIKISGSVSRGNLSDAIGLETGGKIVVQTRVSGANVLTRVFSQSA